MLSLDPGLTTGFSSPLGEGEYKIRTRGHSPIIRDRAMCRQFSRWLADKLHEVQPDVLVIEAPFLNIRQPSAARVLYALRGVALAVAADVEVREIEPRKWQKWAKLHGWSKQKGDGGHVRDAAYLRMYYESVA